MEVLKEVASQLLPILGVVVLSILIYVCIQLAKVLKSLNVTLDKSHATVDLANQSIDKIQAPLDTVVRYSGSLDKAHEAGSKAFNQAKEYVVKNADVLKEKVSSLRNSEEPVKKEPSPEDIIGG